MDSATRHFLRRLAKQYVWWKSPDDAVRQPDRIIAQVMNMGDYDDVLALVDRVGEDQLRHVLTHAEIGQFNARSWTYWHYRLGLTQPGQAIPAPPKRQLG